MLGHFKLDLVLDGNCRGSPSCTFLISVRTLDQPLNLFGRHANVIVFFQNSFGNSEILGDHFKHPGTQLATGLLVTGRPK